MPFSEDRKAGEGFHHAPGYPNHQRIRNVAGLECEVPQLFRRGEIWRPSFQAVTQVGNYASAPDPRGGLWVGCLPLAPALDTSTAHPPVMIEPAYQDTTGTERAESL